MNKKFIFLLISLGCSLGVSMGMTMEENKQITGYDGTRKLSRHKRYLAFPEGSSFSVRILNVMIVILIAKLIRYKVAFCGTFGYIGNPNYIYISWAINYAVAYDLPNETWVIAHENLTKQKPKPEMQRRHRRDLYNKLEVVIDK